MRVAIAGGGISGVAAAYELAVQHPDIDFVLYEASDRLGGTVETVHEQGFTIECGPDSWVTEKPWARALAEELGLGDEVIPSNDHQRRTYITQGRALLPMPDGMRMMVPTNWEPLVHSPLLSWQAKQAYLREPKRAEELKASALMTRGENADESVTAFVERHFGEEATRTFAGPLLAGVFGGDIARLSVKAVMAPFVKMEAETGSLITAVRDRMSRPEGGEDKRPATFTTLRSGLGTLIDRMVDRLPPSSIRFKTPVNRVQQHGEQWIVETRSGPETFDVVLLATPTGKTRSLLCGIHHPAAAQIADQLPSEASSAICVAVGFVGEEAKRLRVPRGFGFLVQGESDKPGLLAATFVDQKFAHRAPPGGVLLRGFFGGKSARQLRDATDEKVTSLTLRELSRYLGVLPSPDVGVVRHWPESLPQYHVGHIGKIAKAEKLLAKLPGLRLLGNAYHGVGLPDLVRDARAAVTRIVSVRVVEARL